MKVILLCIFTLIFYTILTEFASEDSSEFSSNRNSVINKAIVNAPNKKPVDTEKIEASSSVNADSNKDNIIDEALIDEALHFDEKAGSLNGVQNSLEQALLGSLADKQLSIEGEKQYKKQFIREYLKKAKQAGYDILLNDQLQVISIKPRKTYEPIFIEDDDE